MALQHPHNLNYEPSTWIDVDLKPICSGKNSCEKEVLRKKQRKNKKHTGTFYHSKIFEVYSNKPMSYGLTPLPYK